MGEAQIEKNLRIANQHYCQALYDEQDVPKLFCKLALLELKGWLEQRIREFYLDTIEKMELKNLYQPYRISEYMKYYVGESGSKDNAKKKVINTNYFGGGLRYLLILLLGCRDVDRLEGKLLFIIERLDNDLEFITKARNAMAHTFTSAPRKLPKEIAPSQIIHYYDEIKKNLAAIENEIIVMLKSKEHGN